MHQPRLAQLSKIFKDDSLPRFVTLYVLRTEIFQIERTRFICAVEVRGRGSRRARPPLMQVRWPDVVKFNNRCNLLKHHRYLRPIMQPSDSTRKNLLCVSASSQHFPECNGPRYLLEQRRNWLMLQSRVLLHCCVLRMPCLPRGLRSALLRKASVLRNWLLRKWDAR